MGPCQDCVASLLGVCRGDFCQAERTALVERAERAAAQLDHDLGAFDKVDGQPRWRSECRNCGLVVAISIDPEPGQPAMWGKALSASCAHGRTKPAPAPRETAS